MGVDRGGAVMVECEGGPKARSIALHCGIESDCKGAREIFFAYDGGILWPSRVTRHRTRMPRALGAGQTSGVSKGGEVIGTVSPLVKGGVNTPPAKSPSFADRPGGPCRCNSRAPGLKVKRISYLYALVKRCRGPTLLRPRSSPVRVLHSKWGKCHQIVQLTPQRGTHVRCTGCK